MYSQPPPPPPPARPGVGLGRVPTTFWIGAAIALGAFVIKVTTREISAGSDGYSCSYHDYAALAAAVAIVGCTIGGWVSWATATVARRLALPLMLAGSAVLLALAVVHLLRGMGTVGSPCDGHPQP